MLLAFSDMLGGTAWGAQALMWLLDVSLKASLLLLVAALVLRCTRGRSPGLGFSAVSAALVGALMLPALAVMMPRFNVPLLPLPVALSQADIGHQDYQPQQRADSSVAGEMPQGDHAAGLSAKVAAQTSEQPTVSTPQLMANGNGTLVQASDAAAVPTGQHDSLATNSKLPTTSHANENVNTLGPAIFLLWLAGAATGLIWLALALLRLRRWTTGGRALSSAELGYDAEWLQERIGVRRCVRLLESDGVSSPMTYGWRHPVVLLPTSWRGWSRDQIRIVLLHEFMHVRRGDWAYLLMARIACALHWYNPLIWLAARWLEDQRELACDDDVVRCGARPTAYAETLVQMATRMAEPRWGMALSVNMASRPRLENRVVSILRASKRRRAVMTIPTIIGLSGVVGFLSIIEPWFKPAVELTPSHRETGVGRIGGRGAVASSPAETSDDLDLSERIRNWQIRAHTSERVSRTTQTDMENAVQTRQVDSLRHSQDAWLSPQGTDKQDATSQVTVKSNDNERVLRWQQALAGFDDTDLAVRHAVLEGRFAAAQRDARAAAESIRAARQFAPTVTAYAEYQRRAAGLLQFVKDETTNRSDAILAEIQRRIDDQNRAQSAQDQQEIRAHGRRLLNHAVELSRLGQVEEALVVLQRALKLLPDFQEARDLRKTLTAVYEQRAVLQRQHAGDSSELADGDLVEQSTDYGSDRYVRERLATKSSRVRFDDVSFKSAFGQLRQAMNINMVVDWLELEQVGITADTFVSLQLSDVPYERVLAQLLQQVGDGVELGYRIDRGVLEVSTIEALSRATYMQVYQIEDLVNPVPNFRGPRIDWTHAGQSSAGAGGLAGGRYLEGAGLGGTDSGGIIKDDANDDDRNEQDEVTASLIDLIRATIEPESWRSAGGNVGGMSVVNHQLVVTQTRAAHGQLEDL